MPNQPAWLDRAVYVQGPVSLAIEQICIKTWNRSLSTHEPPLTAQLQRHTIEHKGELFIRTRQNDWVRGKVEITRSYLELIKYSRKEIIIMSGYFLPGQFVRNALSKAAARGVAIKVIIAGTSDVLIAKAAERFWYNWLLRNKIKIYEYRSGILHGKVSVYDQQWITIGSYNVNNISAYASVELNLDIRDRALGAATAKDLEEIIANQCTEITGEHVMKHYSVLQRFRFWLSYEIYRIGVFLFTFYFRQIKKG
jgi:cardiolipin synthase